ncbi:hypothetical protein Dsin_026183 [Dipteronia sinensis]|uniref:Pentatricopeptide repeat-containing protein n=1 Tax=Dipteronia sinensis TaxID=43782 RepID=A0AAD9ZYP1_9ROSI|nr:hypothetical protein Dsin_026183 [Dipteronia sinensis]
MFKLNFEILNFYHKCRGEHVKLARFVHSVVNFSESRFDLNRALRDLSKSGRIDEARQLFDEISDRDEFTWNTMIAAYANSGKLIEAKRLFGETHIRVSLLGLHSFLGIVNVGGKLKRLSCFGECDLRDMNRVSTHWVVFLDCVLRWFLLQRGEQIHGYAVKTCC